MNLPLPIACIFMGLLGLALSTLLILRSLSNKAKAANVVFTTAGYFKADWFTPVASLVSILMAFILLPYAPKNWSPAISLLLFGTVGYMGSDIMSRVFSVVNKRINAAIDYKTTISDTATNTLDAPTPALKPQEQPPKP